MDIKNPARTLLLRIKHGKLIRSKQKQLLPFEHRTQNGRILVALVKRGKRLGAKPLAHIESVGFEAIVVNADPFVGVSDGDVESKIVVEHANVVVVVVVGDGVDLGERRVGDVKLDPAGAEDEPEGEDREACNEDELENDF
jgi:hypothetical protein